MSNFRIIQYFYEIFRIDAKWLECNEMKIAWELTDWIPKSLLLFWTILHRRTDSSKYPICYILNFMHKMILLMILHLKDAKNPPKSELGHYGHFGNMSTSSDKVVWQFIL